MPLYSRKLHIRVRRARTSWDTSLTILAFSLGERVVNHLARRCTQALSVGSVNGGGSTCAGGRLGGGQDAPLCLAETGGLDSYMTVSIVQLSQPAMKEEVAYLMAMMTAQGVCLTGEVGKLSRLLVGMKAGFVQQKGWPRFAPWPAGVRFCLEHRLHSEGGEQLARTGREDGNQPIGAESSGQYKSGHGGHLSSTLKHHPDSDIAVHIRTFSVPSTCHGGAKRF